jgi:hypothetical protein
VQDGLLLFFADEVGDVICRGRERIYPADLERRRDVDLGGVRIHWVRVWHFNAMRCVQSLPLFSWRRRSRSALGWIGGASLGGSHCFQQEIGEGQGWEPSGPVTNDPGTAKRRKHCFRTRRREGSVVKHCDSLTTQKQHFNIEHGMLKINCFRDSATKWNSAGFGVGHQAATTNAPGAIRRRSQCKTKTVGFACAQMPRWEGRRLEIGNGMGCASPGRNPLTPLVQKALGYAIHG